MDIMVDYYKILDVPQSASMNDIKKAYRSKVLRWHPDKNPENRKEAEQKFKEIVEAYKVLSDETTRGHYDGSNRDTFKGTKRSEAEKHLSVFDQDGIKIFFTGKRSSSDFSVSFFSAPKRFHHFSIMSAFINGKKITTKRHLENESKYLEVEEDGKTVSIHVNGIPVYDRESNGPAGSEWDYRLDKGHCCPDKLHFWTCERRRWADGWRQWANKWRDWAEECRDWAEGRHHQEGKVFSKAYARHGKTDASKVSEEHLKSETACPKSGGRFPGFSMSGEGKCDLKEGHSRTNKGQSQPGEEFSKTDKGYFVFAKPGEKNSGMDEGHLKKNKKAYKAEEGHPLPEKSNHGFVRTGEWNSDQGEGHTKIKKGPPKTEEGHCRLDGLQKPEHKKTDPRCKAFPTKHKILSEHSSPGGNREPHVEKQDRQANETNTHVAKNEKTLGKKELKDEKLEDNSQKCGSALESQPEKGMELNGMRNKFSEDVVLDSEADLICCSPKGRKENQIRTRKLYSKRSKSQAGRNWSYSSRTKSRGRKGRLREVHSKGETEVNDLSDRGKELILGGQRTPADLKGVLQNRDKESLLSFQEDDIPLQTKKRLLKRRAQRILADAQSEKHPSVSENRQRLGINGQRQKRLIKLPQPNAQLPSIQGQKLGMNQLPNVTR
nr:uncharacterized protein LOC110085710 [Pogona vitticeps]XP_020661791.1 uncharacterized protein LOC110085710 [Pogona vitticeps]